MLNDLLAKKKSATSEQVVICVPTNGLVHAMFSFCLINAIRYTEKQGIPVVLEMDAGTVLSNQRQVLLNLAVDKYNAEHIMWLDSDMTFPEDVIVRLLEHKKNVVCATYSKRVPPFHPTAFADIDPVDNNLLQLAVFELLSSTMSSTQSDHIMYWCYDQNFGRGAGKSIEDLWKEVSYL